MILQRSDVLCLLPCYSIHRRYDEISVLISQLYLDLVVLFLKAHCNYKFKMLSCACGVDNLAASSYRFMLVYDFLSVSKNTRLRLKFFLKEGDLAKSCAGVFPAAGWWEREIWDMYGVFFGGHADLRRLLTDYGFDSHPMRKDFPLMGFFEVRYNDKTKKINLEKVNVAQEFRKFVYNTPW